MQKIVWPQLLFFALQIYEIITMLFFFNLLFYIELTLLTIERCRIGNQRTSVCRPIEDAIVGKKEDDYFVVTLWFS